VRGAEQPILGLPTGNTPIGTYYELAQHVSDGAADFSNTIVYALDEFVGPERDTPGTNSAFYRQYVRFPVRALHVPNPSAADPAQHIRAFADAVRRAGGFDLCVLGVGANGHIAFNEPGSGRDSTARVVDLDEATREGHAGAFGSLSRVPRQGMTLGVADLLEARQILVLALGEQKAGVVRKAIEGRPSADIPASWLQSHGNVTWLIDRAAAAELRA
jgi:glucosamine-6-phosphate deaminase